MLVATLMSFFLFLLSCFMGQHAISHEHTALRGAPYVHHTIGHVIWSVVDTNRLVVRFTVFKRESCVEPAGGIYVSMDTGESVQADHTGCITVGEDVWHFYAAVVTVTRERHHYKIAGILTGVVRAPGNDIFVLGDTGDHGSTLEMLKQNISLASLIVHVGDMSYATNNGECYNDARGACAYDCPMSDPGCAGRKRDTNPHVIEKWMKFFERLEPVSRQIPIITTMGNHDNDLIWFFKFRPPHASSLAPGHLQPYVEKFQHEYKGAPVEKQQALLNEMLTHGHYYGVSLPQLFIMSITSEDNAINPYEVRHTRTDEQRFDKHFGKGSPQFKWCEQTLAALDRRAHPIVVMFSHRPLYHTSRHHPSCKKGGDWYGCRFLETYMPMMEKHSVNFFFSGHSHHYARSTPVHLDEHGKLRRAEGHAPILFVMGNGGFQLSHGYAESPDWIAKRDDQHHGFGVLRGAHWMMIESQNGRVIDNQVS